MYTIVNTHRSLCQQRGTTALSPSTHRRAQRGRCWYGSQTHRRQVCTKHPSPRLSTSHYPIRLVPEGTQIYISPFVLQRDPRYWPEGPDEFRPERWLAQPAGQNAAAFIPFSFGPSNCAGRQLARREMVLVISTLIREFEMAFADDFDWEAWPDTLQGQVDRGMSATQARVGVSDLRVLRSWYTGQCREMDALAPPLGRPLWFF